MAQNTPYTEEDLQSAITDVSFGKSMVEAATSWGIPKDTLHGHCKGMPKEKD
ncbi:hypothetical protein IMZ48_04335, partial [Candidatus Bathyarchaeota archaeon]|nr:hypothetical protein [Candidatus Bathyarchaeota archaeon]